MKLSIILLFTLLANVAIAIEATPIFDKSLNKSLKISCNSAEALCEDLCQSDECSFQELPAQNSLGVSLKLSHFFQNMSRFYKRGQKVSDYKKLKTLLSSYIFVSLDAKSFLNQDFRYNSRSLRRAFKEFCPEGDQPDYPVVLFGQDSFREVGKIRYVLCEKDVYQMMFFEGGEWKLSTF